MRYSGELVLLGPDGAPLARRISDLVPGEKIPWAWSVPSKAMTTAEAEAGSGFPWKWVIIGGATVIVAGGTAAYFMMQGEEDSNLPTLPTHTIP